MNNLKIWQTCALLALCQMPLHSPAQTNSARANAQADGPATLSAEIEKLGKAASGGDAEAQYRLAQKYSTGSGLPRSTQTAVFWLAKAAAQGHVAAQATLGTSYLVGEGTNKDMPMAIHWLTKAAQQDNVLAQTNLGAIYLNGDNTPQNFQQALFWLEKAASQGAPLAQYSLGKMYQHGYGVRTDETVAAQWFNKALLQNYPPAREALAELSKRATGEKNLAATSAAPAVKVTQAASAGPADAAAAERDAILGTIQGWALAWSGRKTDDYLGYYAESFIPANGESRGAWAAQRRARIGGKSHIAVSVSSPEINVRGTVASVVFLQKYSSDQLSETSKKKLILVRQESGWKIQQESAEKISAKAVSQH
ncbi:tetratricopeptide repeat protein [Herbaspirillum robiniae]|uniref:Sel1 repeat family protein n=1 Tax=Herbaspirillum robiniae TaxID=2014887 RepID=A0ABX2M2X9_9BURK|nr:tetratricopeptide repeat protein [Herbaspirillum robiniae]NUU02214.1 sel1 repeat family protein [Herbaspirillum robiniae]